MSNCQEVISKALQDSKALKGGGGDPLSCNVVNKGIFPENQIALLRGKGSKAVPA